MHKPVLKKPILLYMYGLPGSGKTYIANELCDSFGMVHLNSDRLRYELFDNPTHGQTENQIILNLMEYMAELLINSGNSVVFDASLNRVSDRRSLLELCNNLKCQNLMVWIQLDIDTAWTRNQSVDKRKSEEKYSYKLDKSTFEKYIKEMQNPINENYLVLSGKHLFNSHRNAFIRRFREMKLLDDGSLGQNIAKPELVNLIPKAQNQSGRVDYSRRNSMIR